MSASAFNEIAVLWAEHVEAPWPDDLYSAGGPGKDVAEIDGAMAGCISTYLQIHGVLDTDRSRILRSSSSDLEEILPRLQGEAAAYVRRLIRMADLIAF
ncbi:hypothetical protein ACH35V_21485 [Actinomadura sp. 1N219]|uniref:hypothetical protein n=1 Tax=Actinomadura sp. 1N219 TaxID=3375152 RepID=UPI00378AA125